MACTAHQTLFGDQIKKKRWVTYEARMGDRRGAYRVSVRIPDGKRTPRRPRFRWYI